VRSERVTTGKGQRATFEDTKEEESEEERRKRKNRSEA
jgi:hypothetical protein